jgi:opacity protein-like surface antigen
MKNPLVALIVSGCAASSAFAADLPSRKAPPLSPQPAFSWTGFYLGLNAGYFFKGDGAIGTDTSNIFDATRSAIGPASALGASGRAGARLDGMMSGAQIGYNWQFADKFVAGFETDIQGGGNFGNVTSVPPTILPSPNTAATQV